MRSELKTTLMVACLFVTLAILGTIFNFSFKSTLTGNVIQDNLVIKEQVELLSHNLGYDERGDLRVTGTLKNNDDKTLNYVEIKIRFYDENKFLLKSTSESISELKPNEIWKFSSVYPAFNVKEVISYEISVGEIW
jgi:hypothetical protein